MGAIDIVLNHSPYMLLGFSNTQMYFGIRLYSDLDVRHCEGFEAILVERPPLRVGGQVSSIE